MFILGLEKSPSSDLIIYAEPVQRQQGGSDCGLFAVAFLVEVLTGGAPSLARFDQSRLRSHFIACLKEGNWTPFPKQLEAVQRVRSKTMKVKVNTLSNIFALKMLYVYLNGCALVCAYTRWFLQTQAN